MSGAYADLEGFVLAHQACGQLVGDAEPVTDSGYRLWVACGCGARFERWVREEEAAFDLLHSRMLAGEN